MKSKSRPATQEDVQTAASCTKAELRGEMQSMEARLREEIRAVDAKLDRVAADLYRRLDNTATKADVAAINARLDRIIVTLDKLTGKAQDQDRTVLVFDKILKDHRITLDSHERRIFALESDTRPSPGA